MGRAATRRPTRTANRKPAQRPTVPPGSCDWRARRVNAGRSLDRLMGAALDLDPSAQPLDRNELILDG